MTRLRATGSMAAGGRLRDAPAEEWTRPDADQDLFAGGAAASWMERIAARPKRLEVSCVGGTYQSRPCRAHRFQGAEHPVHDCDTCGRTGADHEVRACDGTPGQVVEESGLVWWRPLSPVAGAGERE